MGQPHPLSMYQQIVTAMNQSKAKQYIYSDCRIPTIQCAIPKTDWLLGHPSLYQCINSITRLSLVYANRKRSKIDIMTVGYRPFSAQYRSQSDCGDTPSLYQCINSITRLSLVYTNRKRSKIDIMTGCPFMLQGMP